MDYQQIVFPYRRHADQDAAVPVRHPVVVVGAGPVGLSLAIDLAQRGVPVVLLDDGDRLSTGSRAICFAKRTLEVFDRLGCGERVTTQGVSWKLGRVFLRDQPLYAFDLLPESGHARPAFVNLQQYVVEGCLVERATDLPGVDLRWKHRLVALEPGAQQVILTIETPDGAYRLQADHVVACDGSRSTTRRLMGLESEGRVFRDRFLIADVKMDYDGPAERWFWFDPPFHRGQSVPGGQSTPSSVLLHRQPGNIWRIDFQLGWEADPEQEKQPERILPRVRALLAHSAMKDMPFTLEWASVYTFACQRMASFRHGRVLFAGDAAHGVSPFGARGANSGVQDADNLGWKLAAVVRGRAGDALLDSYARERELAADENIRASTRSTDFITPKSPVSRLFRDAVLALAREHGFARTLLNSGRLSVPATLDGSMLNTADADAFDSRLRPGAVAADAPLRRADGSETWLLRELGEDFTLLSAAGGDADLPADLSHDLPVRPLVVASASGPPPPGACVDTEGLVAQRYDLRPGDAYLIRPDQHVCARWRRPTRAAVEAALRRALGTP